MRVAIANWNRRIAGGSEAYLKSVIGGLEQVGVECALLTEIDEPSERMQLELIAGSPLWAVSEMGVTNALDALRAWHPEVVFVHMLEDAALETLLLEVAPGVLFAHSHRGMCISGEKTFRVPEVRPCDRRFGWPCLAQFYPRRCGGLNPLTMWRDYTVQSQRHSMLPRYSAIVTASKYLARELEKNGVAADRVHTIAMPSETSNSCNRTKPGARVRKPDTARLLFVGRMSRLKGGGMLLDSLPRVVDSLGTTVSVTLVGDGPMREQWENQARVLASKDRRIEVEFAGWTNTDEIDAMFEQSDLLVVPSLEPETFGLVGPEAGRAGVPAAAFDVGGISEWLIDGINGSLAAGDPPSADGLADAILRCLNDPATYERLSRGAIETAQRFDTRTHVDSLLQIFRKVSTASRANVIGQGE
jgi:glycosyltransferase involved in cell wall biosynthesis